MYIYNVPKSNYRDPWLVSFEERLLNLKKGHKKVAYFYETPDNHTFRYRVYNMVQVLQELQNGISAAFFTNNEIDHLDEIVDIANVLVICRSRFNHKISHAIERAQNQGKKVFFDIDDLIFNTKFIPLALDTLGRDLDNPEIWDIWYALCSRLGALMDLCDNVITTNEFLADRLTATTGKHVFVIPNFINQEQMEISTRIFHKKRSNGFKRNNAIHLGYFSGTLTHNKDFQILSDALVQILNRDPRIVIRIVGFLEITGQLRNYLSRIEHFPLQDFINLQRLIGEVEVNLVPLQDNEFTNCKSEIKYFEAGIVGTVTLASPTTKYVQVIKDGENGYLAQKEEWHEKIENLINKPESLQVVAEKAYRESKENYAWYNQAYLIEKTIFP
jgi:glycosyltransferase involved in cell wall biosynthesis